MTSYKRTLRPAIAVAVLLFLHAFVSAPAQSVGSSASCRIKVEEPSDVELAYERSDKNFAKLIAEARKKDPKNDLYRNIEIDGLLGQGKLEEAEKKVDAWISESPNDAYALLSLSEYRHRMGDWPEAYVYALKAIKLDPCLAPAYTDLAEFEEAAGYNATAAKHAALAHQLWPKDDVIWSQWIDTLPYLPRVEEDRKYIAESKILDDKKRAQVMQRFDHLEAFRDDRCELASANGPATIPMVPIDEDGERRWGLEVFFNGKSRNLILDTGASGLTLTLSASSAMQLKPITISRVGGFGASGSQANRVMLASSVRIGNLEFKNCVVDALSEYGSMGGSSMGLGQKLDTQDGLIGSDVFERYLVTLDYVKHEVRLASLPSDPAAPIAATDRDPLGGSNNRNWMLVDRYIAPELKTWTKIYRDGHDLIVPVILSHSGEKGRPALFIADTGSFTDLVDRHAIKEFSQVKSSLSAVQGLSGVEELSEAGAFTVDFAGIRLPVKSMDSLDLSRFGGPVGFLGQPTLEQLVIHLDYRDNLALFEAPNAKKL